MINNILFIAPMWIGFVYSRLNFRQTVQRSLVEALIGIFMFMILTERNVLCRYIQIKRKRYKKK